MEGLEATVLSLSEVRRDNEKLRVDSAYFGKAAMRLESEVRSFKTGFVELGDTARTFRKGIFDIKADSYTEEGVPFIRISNLRNGIIDESSIAYISEDAHKTESKTEVTRGDLALSKTAYPSASYVQLQKANVSQDVIAYRMSPDWKKRLRSGFLAAYLNSTAGNALMQRQFQGNVQLHLSLDDARKIPVPLMSDEFQGAVETAFLKAFEEMNVSDKKLHQAEQTLLAELGLADWAPPEPLTYQRSAKDVTDASRFDAEHFREKYLAARKVLDKSGAIEWIPFSELITLLTNGHTPLGHDLTEGDVPFLCAEHVSDFEIEYASDKRILAEHHGKELARTALRNGDVLLTIKGKVGNAVVVENVPGAVNINQDVALLRLNKRLPKWWVVTYMNSLFGKLQTEQFSTGAINPFLGLFSIRKMAIPKFPEEQMSRIVEQTKQGVQSARASRRRAHNLMESAKRAVEIAIEDSEEAALAYLAKENP